MYFIPWSDYFIDWFNKTFVTKWYTSGNGDVPCSELVLQRSEELLFLIDYSGDCRCNNTRSDRPSILKSEEDFRSIQEMFTQSPNRQFATMLQKVDYPSHGHLTCYNSGVTASHSSFVEGNEKVTLAVTLLLPRITSVDYDHWMEDVESTQRLEVGVRERYSVTRCSVNRHNRCYSIRGSPGHCWKVTTVGHKQV